MGHGQPPGPRIDHGCHLSHSWEWKVDEAIGKLAIPLTGALVWNSGLGIPPAYHPACWVGPASPVLCQYARSPIWCLVISQVETETGCGRSH
jgi:hypothetical protein